MATENLICEYSDLPSLMVYQFLVDDDEGQVSPKKVNGLSAREITRIIKLAWESPAPFDVVEYLYGLSETSLKKLMKSKLKFRCYTVWRKQAEICCTQYRETQHLRIRHFKSAIQRIISSNKISKYRLQLH